MPAPSSTMAALAIAALAPLAADAASVALAGDGQWHGFAVDGLLEPSLAWIDDSGASLSFAFTVAPGAHATLAVVDTVFAGDSFQVTNFGKLLGHTSSVPLTDIASAPSVGYDADAAFANAAFSRASFSLGAGSYRISGLLDQSVLAGGERLDATGGALRLVTSAVPEPSPLWLAGIGAVVLLTRRRLSR